jgi:DNA-binding response OmpR family regulator
MRVLIVEDNVDSRTALQALLASYGYDVETAETRKEGVAALEKSDFDLVLTDLQLPDSRYLDTVDSIKEAAGNTPVIVLSAVGDEHTASEAVQTHGAAAYMVKPVQVKVLLEEMIIAINRAG